MPIGIEKCTDGGKPGWKFGKKGQCYTGKLGKAKAMREGAERLAKGPEKKPAAKKASAKPAEKKAASKSKK